MLSLFPTDSAFPQGFEYIPAFITESEEAELLRIIQDTAFHAFQFQGYEAKRRVATYGYDWDFTTRSLSTGADIP